MPRGLFVESDRIRATRPDRPEAPSMDHWPNCSSDCTKRARRTTAPLASGIESPRGGIELRLDSSMPPCHCAKPLPAEPLRPRSRFVPASPIHMVSRLGHHPIHLSLGRGSLRRRLPANDPVVRPPPRGVEHHVATHLRTAPARPAYVPRPSGRDPVRRRAGQRPVDILEPSLLRAAARLERPESDLDHPPNTDSEQVSLDLKTIALNPTVRESIVIAHLHGRWPESRNGRRVRAPEHDERHRDTGLFAPTTPRLAEQRRGRGRTPSTRWRDQRS